MGGTQKHHVVRLGNSSYTSAVGPTPPYDGEVWSWSSPELNRIAYMDKDGDLWVAQSGWNRRGARS